MLVSQSNSRAIAIGITILSTFASLSSTFLHHRFQIHRRNTLQHIPGAHSQQQQEEQQQEQREQSNKKQRKPPGFWSRPENFITEIRQFWLSLGIQPNATSLPIPNDALLKHFERHDIRNAIYYHGGRDDLVENINFRFSSSNTKRYRCHLISGHWKEAVRTSPEMRALVRNETLGLDRWIPPASVLATRRPKMTTTTTTTTRPMAKGDASRGFSTSSVTRTTRWEHSKTRKPKNYWNEELVISELYDYLANYQRTHGRPSVYMPRSSELTKNGRDDLRQAMMRFGGCDAVRRRAGLIPHHEWIFFERQLRLVTELRRIVATSVVRGDNDDDERGGGGGEEGYVMPPLCDCPDELRTLVTNFGGRKLIAMRLGLNLGEGGIAGGAGGGFGDDGICGPNDNDLFWGEFSLDFALDLLNFVKDDLTTKHPPYDRMTINMPTRRYLLDNYGGDGGGELLSSIERYGGYENVARRLGLAFDLGRNTR